MTRTTSSRRAFLKASTLSALGGFLFRNDSFSLPHTQALTVYVGTYTAPGKSEGIYIYQMNSLSGELRRINSMMSVNPSYLALGVNKHHLYAVNEVGEFGGKASGAISAYAIDAAGNLKFLNQQPSLGADPCYLTVAASGKFLLVANYTGGSLSVLPIQRDGRLGPATDHIQHEGSSVHENQKGPHAHCIILDRSNRYALAADLGIDKVMIYRFDRGILKPGNQLWASLKAGAGPRHITLHPSERYAYVINEIDSTITVFHYNRVNGRLNALQTVTTLPGDFSGHNDCADVHISSSGNFLYGSNRGHDSIVVFAINKQTGTLTYVEHTSTQGKTPRNFTIDPTGRFLLAANQNSDSVVTFRIDPFTGTLKPTGHVAEIPTPVCLKFM
ncbi:MAG TPA: lactonase family protein [Pyrinomonadaceae bacterium]